MVKILFRHAEYRGICLGFLYGGEWSVGDTDCHSQCAHWLRNDTVNKRCSTSPGGRTKASAPTEAFKGCVGEGLCPSRRAGKSAKRRRWRMQRAGFEEVPRLADTTVAGNRLARRWAREPRPYGEVAKGAVKESPSHGFAVPAPFRQGGRGDGGTDCHGRCAPSQ